MPKLNEALLTQTLEHIEKLDKQHREWTTTLRDEPTDSQYRIEHMAEVIRNAPDDLWDQGDWGSDRIKRDPITGEYHRCGTTACFAGWSLVLMGENPIMRERKLSDLSVEDRAQELLGLSDSQAAHLFYTVNNIHTLRERVQGILAGKYR